MIKALIASAAVLVAAPALAGGTAPAPASAPAVVPVAATSDWTGAYAGLQFDLLDGDAAIGGALDGDAFGLFGGYRRDFGTFVLGGEIDYMVGEMSPVAGPSIDVDALLRLGVEAGFDAGPALIYATVGWAQMDVSVAGLNFDFDGTFYGIGVDYAVTDRVTIGAELLRHDFNDINGIAGNDLDATTFGINVAYRF